MLDVSEKLLASTPSTIKAMIDGLSENDRAEVLLDIEELAIGAVVVAGYLRCRCTFGGGDIGHDAAAKNANIVHGKIRESFGRCPSTDIEF